MNMEINQEKVDAVRRALYGVGIAPEEINDVTNRICKILLGKSVEEFCEETEGYFTPTLEVEWMTHYDFCGEAKPHKRSYPFEDFVFDGDQDIADFKEDFLLFLAQDCLADNVPAGTSFTVRGLTFSKHDAFGDKWLDSEDTEVFYWDGTDVIPEIN